jgi:hypothetical protein
MQLHPVAPATELAIPRIREPIAPNSPRRMGRQLFRDCGLLWWAKHCGESQGATIITIASVRERLQ